AQQIRTPPPPPTPQINGPDVFGVTPGNPVLYKIPATGNGAITYSVSGLPNGLSVNPTTGLITGTIKTAGTYNMTLQATNSLGTNSKSFKIEVGSTINLTPAMGWNDWNCYGSTVTASEVLANANAMATSGLINYGWTYVNVDDSWQGARGGPYDAIQGDSKFPAMAGLSASIHGLGLKFGVYSTPWIQSYAGYTGGSANNPQGAFTKVSDNSQKVDGTHSFAANDAAQWAQWGVDYLKYDWNPRSPNPVSNAQFQTETQTMQQALDNCGRDIVFSYSNSMPFDQISTQEPMLNSWRIAGDVRDNWSSISGEGFGQDKWIPYTGPGHHIDPDMLVVGYVGWGATQHASDLTPDEQYTQITLWSLLSAPLLLGCDLTRLDPFTLNLLENPDVLSVDQDALAKQAATVENYNSLEVLEKPLENGSIAVGLFNLSGSTATVQANWSSLGITGMQNVEDLWREEALGVFNGSFSMSVASHSAELVEITPVPLPEPVAGLALAAGSILLLRRGPR
ncbi:MAG TPA: putative Ig domain-containing protein, partial [Tepidisphaeraceae bacterium]|nr:putative Ig domain-containing protein [Tepidisphaeraceae bacterium]